MNVALATRGQLQLVLLQLCWRLCNCCCCSSRSLALIACQSDGKRHPAVANFSSPFVCLFACLWLIGPKCAHTHTNTHTCIVHWPVLTLKLHHKSLLLLLLLLVYRSGSVRSIPFRPLCLLSLVFAKIGFTLCSLVVMAFHVVSTPSAFAPSPTAAPTPSPTAASPTPPSPSQTF